MASDLLGGGSELRQRKRETGDAPELSSPMAKLAKRIKTFDAFPKVEEDYAVQTNTGAAVSLITGAVIVILLISEVSDYSTVKLKQHTAVDHYIHHQDLIINFNITFPALMCGDVMIDSMDVAGEQQVNVGRDVYKWRVDKQGVPIGEPYLDHHIVNPHPFAHGHGGHGHDHGHEGEQAAPTTTSSTTTPQAAGGAPAEKEVLEDPSHEGEGCIIYGSLHVMKVAGNFHIALGASHKAGGKHVHHFMISEARRYNSSHIINHLSFGKKSRRRMIEEQQGPRIHPLDGVRRILLESTGHFQYFIKVVPTLFIDIDGRKLRENQYSVTEQWKEVNLLNPNAPQKIPGVFFIYDISPFQVVMTEYKQPFMEFVINICAVIGGVFTIAGMVDSLLFHGTRIMKQTIQQQ